MDILQRIDAYNKMYWLFNGDTVDTKYCKLANGFVRYDYDCDGCKLCESKDIKGE